MVALSSIYINYSMRERERGRGQCTECAHCTVHKYLHGLKRTLITAQCACVVSCLHSPSPSHGTKIFIDGLLSRVEPREKNSIELTHDREEGWDNFLFV